MENIMNWDDIQETSYVNKEGKYTFKVIEIVKKDGVITQTTANGKPFHKFLCETKDGERINISFYLVDKAMWRYKAFVKACGLETKGVVNLDELPKLLIGKKFVGEVQRQPDVINVETGIAEPSKYFEIAKFFPVEG